MTDRRSVLRGLLLLALTGRRLQAAPPALSLADQAEAALMRGDAEQAMQAFELAASTGHDHVNELGLMRAAMQAGRYRQAMAFAAHTAAEHAHEADSVAAYVWLLHLGGQHELARHLGEASQGREDDGSLRQAMAAWAGGPWPMASGVLRQPPVRLAPYAFGARIDPEARLLGSGTLCPVSSDGVQRVIGPPGLVRAGAGRWWVRNGLGQTAPARLETVHANEAVAVWRMEDGALPGGCVLAERDAFPGSPVHAWAYALPDATPAQQAGEPATPSEARLAPAGWPVMHIGFAGRIDAQRGPLLGIDVPTRPANPWGGPVCNAQGRLLGVALAADGAARLWPASAMRALPWWPAPEPPYAIGQSAPAPARMPVDALYEQALQACVQLVFAP